MPEVVMRSYEDADEAQVLELLAASLGKVVDDRYRAFFRWKHRDSPFGPSFMWVAEVDGVVAGLRAFMRWRFIDPTGDPVEAVRAVDTATSPDFRGMGIFRDLTMHGLGELRPSGVQFVFNTPNDQSRPGYLKMGWRLEERVPVKVRPRSTRSLFLMARSRTAAEPWSRPADVGQNPEAFAHLVAPAGSTASLVTERSPAFVRWRYSGFTAVSSRALPAEDGAVIARFRRRGEAIECTVGDVLGDVDPATAAVAVRRAVREIGADYTIAAASTPVGGMVPAPRLGPVLARRDVVDDTTRCPLLLVLGDVELF